jgi:hypothetical protein
VPAIQSTVDLDKATYTNRVGSTELKTVWTDPEVRREPARLLLRPRAGDTHATLDPHPGRQGGAAAARCRAADGAGTRLELAYLVCAVGRGAQECSGGHDRQRAGQEGGRCPERRAAEGASRRQGDLGAQQRDGRAVFPAVHGRRTDDRVARWNGRRLPERVRQRRARWLPGNDLRLPHRERQARHPGGAGPVFVHVLQGRRHLPCRAQQRVRLCQLRNCSCAADRSQSADVAVHPVLDRAGADGREKNRPDPPAGSSSSVP